MTAGQDDSSQGGPKKPSAMLDLKPTQVNVAAQDEREPGAATGATGEASTPGGPEGAAEPQGGADAGDGAATPNTMLGRHVLSGSLHQRLTRVLTHLAAGLAGGMIALGAADLLFGPFGEQDATSPIAMVDLNRRVTALESNPGGGAVPGELAQQVAGIQGRVARLEEAARTIGELREAQTKLGNDMRSLEQRLASAPAGGSVPADMQARVAKLEETLGALSAAAGTDPQRGRIPQLAAITGKLADLEAALANQAQALRQSTAQEIEARVGPAAEASEAARADAQRLDRELAALKAEASRLKASGDKQDQSLRAAQDETNSLKTAVEGLKGELGSVARRPDVEATVAPLSARLATLEQGLQQVSRGEEDRRANAERVLLALELGSLKRVIERGGSYAAELGELRRQAAGKLNLSVLERYQDQGVPALSELQREFRGLTFSIIEGDAEPPDASVVDRLIAGARSIVRIRKTNQGTEDQSAEAVVARMERALKDGKLATVMEESRKLSPKAHERARPWLEKVEARAAVDLAIADLETQTKTAIAGGGKRGP